MLIDGYVAEQMEKAMLNSEQEQVKIYDAYYNKCVTDGYNQALEDFEKCLIQQSLYTETEEGWSGMTIDTKTIKGIKEQLKR